MVDEKRAYDQAFVTLASASASAAGIAGARELLNRALSVFENRFWESGPGLAVDVWNRDWTELEAYRGANANMHTVEALLAAGDVTGERIWAERAAGIVESLIHGVAREYHWRLPEHFDEHWTVLPEFNRNEPAHPFRPYGVTIGHLFEWARLCLHVRHALGESAPDWLLADAKDLFAVGIRDGWEVDGAPGFVYTTDFDGAPVIRSRLHWVVTEALATAWTLLLTTGEQDYQTWFERWCDYAERYFVDRADGSWHHELDASNQPAATVWEGKPDVYHAFQATLLPRLPLCSSLAGGLLANAT